MTIYLVRTKTKKGKWITEKGKYKSYRAAFRAALFYKKKGRKAKVVDLKGEVWAGNLHITLMKFAEILPG